MSQNMNPGLVAEARDLLDELRHNAALQDLMCRMQDAQHRTELDDTWDTAAGRQLERVFGYLSMALDAAQPPRR